MSEVFEQHSATFEAELHLVAHNVGLYRLFHKKVIIRRRLSDFYNRSNLEDYKALLMQMQEEQHSGLNEIILNPQPLDY